ncbi:protein AKNAD1 [Hipposideros larvatus]
MDEPDFSEDTTLKQQEDLPYDGDFSQTKQYNDYNLTLKNDILDASDQIISTVDNPQEKATDKEACRNIDMALMLDPKPENAVKKKYDTNLHIPANKGDLSKSNISDILLHHLSKEEFLKSQGINCETLPEISNADSFDEAIVKNIILCYIKNSWTKEQTPELTDQLDPKRDGEICNQASCPLATTEENTSDLEEPVAAGDRCHPENSDFLTKTNSPKNKQTSCQGQTPQKEQTEKTRSDNGFIYGQGQVHYWFSDFSKMEPTIHPHEEHPAGIESETSLFKLASTSQKDPSSNSSYIFQKISQGEKMCQKLKEQTDQLKMKVQEFSKSITQDSPYHLQDKRLVLEKLQGHLEFLEQEFLANKEKHLTLKQQVLRLESPAVSDFDPERKVEGEIFKLEMLFEDVKEKIDEGKQTSMSSLPVSSPTTLDDLASTPSPPANEGDPNSASGRQERAETTSWSCAFCHWVPEWKQKMEKKGHRRINRGRFPIALRETAPRPDSILSPDTGHSCYSASDTGLQGSKCETCGTKIPHSPRVCHQEPLKEFHYRYNTPGQNYLDHSERSAFVQFSSLDENKLFSPSCSKSKWICSETANSKSSQEHELMPGKKNLEASTTYSSDLTTPSPPFHSCGVSGSEYLRNFSSVEEMESEVLNSSLDHALRTATILKETTDQMIRTIAEDLAKLQRWRNRLKY